MDRTSRTYQETKNRLIEIQYESFTSNERRRESTVLQFVVVIGAIITALGYILNSTHCHKFALLTLFCFIGIAIFVWLGCYVINSSYQFRCGQAILSKIRRKYNNLDGIIPKKWNIIEDPDRDILTNYYHIHLCIIRFFIILLGILPLSYFLYCGLICVDIYALSEICEVFTFFCALICIDISILAFLGLNFYKCKLTIKLKKLFL